MIYEVFLINSYTNYIITIQCIHLQQVTIDRENLDVPELRRTANSANDLRYLGDKFDSAKQRNK